MGHRRRYDLTIRRLNGGRLRDDVPERVIEFMDLDDDREVETVLARHFVALAASAAGETPHSDPEFMPWLVDYVLDVHEHGRSEVEFSYRGTPTHLL